MIDLTSLAISKGVFPSVFTMVQECFSKRFLTRGASATILSIKADTGFPEARSISVMLSGVV